jgi:hypothetical protein
MGWAGLDVIGWVGLSGGAWSISLAPAAARAGPGVLAHDHVGRRPWLGRRFVLHRLGQKRGRFRAKQTTRRASHGPRLPPAKKETAMSRTSAIDDSRFWSTIDDAIDDEFEDVVLDMDDGDFAADWYQDAPEVTVPRECLPHWRTVH